MNLFSGKFKWHGYSSYCLPIFFLYHWIIFPIFCHKKIYWNLLFEWCQQFSDRAIFMIHIFNLISCFFKRWYFTKGLFDNLWGVWAFKTELIEVLFKRVICIFIFNFFKHERHEYVFYMLECSFPQLCPSHKLTTGPNNKTTYGIFNNDW